MGGFDFVIVGSGSAGSVLADKLSASGRFRVLLIEEGPGDNHWLLRMPHGFGKILQNPRYTSYYMTNHRRGEDSTPEIWARGKTLGGSSSVNGLVWVRGQPEDYDRIAELGNPGWSWAEVAPYFKALEDHALGEDEVRGAGGPIAVRRHPDRSRLADAFIAAGAGLGVPAKDDLNRPEQEGIGYLALNVDRKGRRASASKAFVDPARKRPNLEIWTDTRVERVLFEGKRAVGVAARRKGVPIEIRTDGEIILCAGALASPKILQLSGVGPAALLQAHGVSMVHDSPGVGRNMREHYLLALQYGLKAAGDSNNREYSGWRVVKNVARYMLTGKGIMSYGAYTAAGFTRTDGGLNRPDAQLMFAPWSMVHPSMGVGFDRNPSMHVFGYLLRPDSQGWLEITSADPAAPPLIAPEYLAAETDRKASVAMIRQIRALMAQPPIAALVTGERELTARAQTDDEIIDAFLRYGAAGFHACGTCAMGQGPEAVVDARLRVRGVEGLRVMDTSIFPEMLSGNLNAPTMALAWRAADLILADRQA